VSEGVQQDAVRTVLVVEDNPADVRLVEEGIAAADTDLELRVYNNGNRAVEWITSDTPQRHQPNLVLLDLNIPGKSGLEVLRAVREESEFSRVPVAVVSSSKNPDDARRVYDQSADAYVTKPADPDQYIQMIGTAVRFWIPTADTQPNDE
jgi:CheY-like chemotaxis protein